MKNSLEDLLKQVYEQKEVPSQEFCQAVLREMKKRERKASFWNRDVIYQKGILVTICIGMVVLIGLGMVHWRRGIENRGISFKQDIAERENPTPVVSDDPVGVKDRVETEDLADKENQVETEDMTDSENEVETVNPTGVENTAGTNPIPGGGQKRRKASDPLFSGRTDLGLQKPEQNPTAEPENQNTEPSGMDTEKDSGNKKPQIMETARPAETVKPSQPSGAMTPQNTPMPQENYISLCSIETYTFSNGFLISDMEESTPGPSAIFFDQLILSYEQLQTLVQKLENSLDWKGDDSIQEFLIQLKKYDENYFVSNVLCISIVSLQAETDLRLCAVWVCDMGQGSRYLDISMDKVGNKTDQSSDMRYYSSVICVPREIAGQCSMVRFQYSDGE